MNLKLHITQTPLLKKFEQNIQHTVLSLEFQTSHPRCDVTQIRENFEDKYPESKVRYEKAFKKLLVKVGWRIYYYFV